jgi:hypothetical protein
MSDFGLLQFYYQHSLYCELDDLLLVLCSDIVQMASYAPLFVNNNDQTLVFMVLSSTCFLCCYWSNSAITVFEQKQSGGTRMPSSSTPGNIMELLVTGCRHFSVSPVVP